MYTNDQVTAVATRLAAASRVTVLTGAGVSAASGVPTFRGAGGQWGNFKAQDLATRAGFVRDPELVWDWYAWRRKELTTCKPNRAHEILAAWSHRFPRFSLVTQNVDGLHEAAGTRHVVRLHGSIWEIQCLRPCPRGATPWEDRRIPLDPMPPMCPHCGKIARPAVVWFGENLSPTLLEQAEDATHCDVFLSIGTSSVVYPAAGLLHDARRRGAFTVEINPEATDASDVVDVALAGGAEVVLDEIAKRLG